MILTDEFAGICLRYIAIHGEEDRKNALNPADEAAIIQNFKEMFKTK
jgi:hypothetical protein